MGKGERYYQCTPKGSEDAVIGDHSGFKPGLDFKPRFETWAAGAGAIEASGFGSLRSRVLGLGFGLFRILT